MNKKLAITFILAAFLIGAFGGSISTNLVWGRFLDRFGATGQSAQVGLYVSSLNRLRENHVRDAVELLEIELDGSLIEFGNYVSHTPKSRLDPTQMKIILMAKEYRDKYPRQSRYPEIDQSVSSALALAITPADK